MEGIVHTEREKTWSAMSACAAFALSSMIRNASLFVWDLVYFDRLFPLHVAFGTVCPNERGLGSEGRTQLRPLIYWCFLVLINLLVLNKSPPQRSQQNYQ